MKYCVAPPGVEAARDPILERYAGKIDLAVPSRHGPGHEKNLEPDLPCFEHRMQDPEQVHSVWRRDVGHADEAPVQVRQLLSRPVRL